MLQEAESVEAAAYAQVEEGQSITRRPSPSSRQSRRRGKKLRRPSGWNSGGFVS